MLNTPSDPLPLNLSVCTERHYGVTLMLCFPAACSLSASGSVQCFSFGTKPIMHCRGHAHTLMRVTRKDTYFCNVVDSAGGLHTAAPKPTLRLSLVFLCAPSAACFDPCSSALRPLLIFPCRHVIRGYFKSGKAIWSSCQQRKKSEAVWLRKTVVEYHNFQIDLIIWEIHFFALCDLWTKPYSQSLS